MGRHHRQLAGVRRADRPQLPQHGPARPRDERHPRRHRLCGLDGPWRRGRHHRQYDRLRRPRERSAGGLYGNDRSRGRGDEGVRERVRGLVCAYSAVLSISRMPPAPKPY